MKTTRIFLLLLIAMIGCNMPVTAQSAASTSSHKITVVADTTTKKASKAELVGEYIKDGKSYPLYRGSRGGYYYLTGKTTKDGKPERKYLSKKEKEANNLK